MIKLLCIVLSLSLFFFLSCLLLSWSRELQQVCAKSSIVTFIIVLVENNEDNCSPSATLLLILLPTSKFVHSRGSPRS